MADQAAGILPKRGIGDQADAADKGAVSDCCTPRPADQTSGARAADLLKVEENGAEYLHVADRGVFGFAEQTRFVGIVAVVLRAGKHIGDVMSPAFKGAVEGDAGIGGVGVVADRDPAVAAQVDVRREGDGIALEGEAVADLLCERREVGGIGDDPVAGRGGVERGIVVSVVRPEGFDLRLRGGENFAALSAARAFRKQLGFEDDEDLMPESVAGFKGTFGCRALGGRAADSAGVIIERTVSAVGFGL